MASMQESDQQRPFFDHIAWRVGENEPLAEHVSRLRDLLAERGRLLLIGEPRSVETASAQRQELVAILSASGFVILEENIDSPPPWIEPSPSNNPSFWLLAQRDRFLVRSYREGDEREILRLFKPSFHTERSLEHWRWKFTDNPFGRLQLSMAFSPEGELAAHHGAYPVPFRQQDGSTIQGLQIGDLMTDPRYRRVGLGPRSLLARCARHSYAVFGAGKAAFNYGFNTATSLEFSLRYMNAEKVRPVDFWSLEPSSLKVEHCSRYRVVEVRAIGSTWDRFFRRVAPSYGFLVERRSRCLRWRYLKRPDVEYLILAVYRFRRLVGWSVFKRQDDRLIWGDALFDQRHAMGAARAALLTALRSPQAVGISRVDAWFSQRPRWWTDVLEQLGFAAQAEPNDLWMTCVPHELANATEKLQQLYYTMGDGDLF